MLSFASCPPVPQYTVASCANATIWSRTVSYQCLNQGVTHPPCPVYAFLWLRVDVEEVWSCAAF